MRDGVRRDRLRREPAPPLRHRRDTRGCARAPEPLDPAAARRPLVRCARRGRGVPRPLRRAGAGGLGAGHGAAGRSLVRRRPRAARRLRARLRRPPARRAATRPAARLPLQRRALRGSGREARARGAEAAPLRTPRDQAQGVARQLGRADPSAALALRPGREAARRRQHGLDARRSARPHEGALAPRDPLLRAAAPGWRPRRRGPARRRDRTRGDGRRELHHPRISRGADRAARVHRRERAHLEVRRAGRDSRALPRSARGGSRRPARLPGGRVLAPLGGPAPARRGGPSRAPCGGMLRPPPAARGPGFASAPVRLRRAPTAASLRSGSRRDARGAAARTFRHAARRSMEVTCRSSRRS